MSTASLPAVVGETAPLNVSRPGVVGAIASWRIAVPAAILAGTNSYHLTFASGGAPNSAISCWVQMAGSPTLGSVRSTACVSRPSRVVAIVLLVPGWETSAGNTNGSTLMSPSETSVGFPREYVRWETESFDGLGDEPVIG